MQAKMIFSFHKKFQIDDSKYKKVGDEMDFHCRPNINLKLKIC